MYPKNRRRNNYSYHSWLNGFVIPMVNFISKVSFPFPQHNAQVTFSSECISHNLETPGALKIYQKKIQFRGKCTRFMSLSLAPWEKSVQYYKVYVPWIAGVLWPVLLLLLFSNLIVNSGVNIVLWMCRMIQPKYSTKVLFYCVSAKLNWNHWFQWSVKRTLFLLLKSVAFSSLILGYFVPFVIELLIGFTWARHSIIHFPNTALESHLILHLQNIFFVCLLIWLSC